MIPIEGENIQHHAHGPHVVPSDVTPQPILEHAMAFWRSAVLLSAHDLGVFAGPTAGPRAPDELARTLDLRHDAVVELLEALTTLGLAEPAGSGYRATVQASHYLDPAKPTCIDPWLVMARSAMRAMANLSDDLRAEAAKQDPVPSLADRMWSDIAGILHTAFPPDRA